MSWAVRLAGRLGAGRVLVWRCGGASSCVARRRARAARRRCRASASRAVRTEPAAHRAALLRRSWTASWPARGPARRPGGGRPPPRERTGRRAGRAARRGRPAAAPPDAARAGRRPRRLAQALGNLLANAAEHGAGEIELRGRRRSGRAPRDPQPPPARRTGDGRPRAAAGSRIAERAARELGGRLGCVGGGQSVARLELPARRTPASCRPRHEVRRRRGCCCSALALVVRRPGGLAGPRARARVEARVGPPVPVVVAARELAPDERLRPRRPQRSAGAGALRAAGRARPPTAAGRCADGGAGPRPAGMSRRAAEGGGGRAARRRCAAASARSRWPSPAAPLPQRAPARAWTCSSRPSAPRARAAPSSRSRTSSCSARRPRATGSGVDRCRRLAPAGDRVATLRVTSGRPSSSPPPRTSPARSGLLARPPGTAARAGRAAPRRELCTAALGPARAPRPPPSGRPSSAARPAEEEAVLHHARHPLERGAERRRGRRRRGSAQSRM